jgi:GINS complex subunit 1
MNRVWRIEQACWKRDPTVLTDAVGENSTTAAFLSEAERTYADHYEALIAWYGSLFGLDLRSALFVPPREEFIEVRVLEDCGDIVMASSGKSVRLAAGTLHFLNRADVEVLIQQGKLEHVLHASGLR